MLYPGVLFPSSTSKGGMLDCLAFLPISGFAVVPAGMKQLGVISGLVIMVIIYHVLCGLLLGVGRCQGGGGGSWTGVGPSQALITHCSGSNDSGNRSFLLPPPL